MSLENVESDLEQESGRKYTRGEHCIYTNLVISFVVLSLTVAVYLVHLYTVNHYADEVFKMSAIPPKVILRDEEPEWWPLAVVWVHGEPERVVCHGVLLRARWTAAPAHCVTLRSSRALQDLRDDWRITYAKNTTGYEETEIKSSITHPGFSADDFSNNVGLFEHERALLVGVDLSSYLASQYVPMSDNVLTNNQADIYMVGMTALNTSEAWNASMVKQLGVPILRGECGQLTALALPAAPRRYEFCLTYPSPRRTNLHRGAGVVMNSRLVGLVSWGDRGSRGVPFVALHLLYYDLWMADILDPASAAPDADAADAAP